MNSKTYENELFNGKNSYLSDQVRQAKESLTNMLITKVLLVLLFKDIKAITTQEPRLGFDFKLGLYMKEQRCKQKRFKSFDGEEMARHVTQASSGKTRGEQQFLALCRSTVLKIIRREHPFFLR